MTPTVNPSVFADLKIGGTPLDSAHLNQIVNHILNGRKFNPRDYKVSSDPDDTLSFQRAIQDAGDAGGGVLQWGGLSPYNPLITDTLAMRHGVYVLGHSRYTNSLLTFAPASPKWLFQFGDGATTGVTRGGLAGFRVQGNNTALGCIRLAGTGASATTYNLFRDLHIGGFDGAGALGIKGEISCWANDFKSVQINCNGGNAVSVLDEMDETLFSACRFYSFNHQGTGVYVNGSSSSVKFDNCSFVHWNYAADIDTNSRNLTFDGCFFEDSFTRDIRQRSGQIVVPSLRILGSRFSSTCPYGIEIGDTGAFIAAPYFRNQYTTACILFGTLSHDNVLIAGLRSGVTAPLVSDTGTHNTNLLPDGIKPTVTGSRSGNAALASLLTQLGASGLVIDSTTA